VPVIYIYVPALENNLSDGTDVATSDKYYSAILAI